MSTVKTLEQQHGGSWILIAINKKPTWISNRRHQAIKQNGKIAVLQIPCSK